MCLSASSDEDKSSEASLAEEVEVEEDLHRTQTVVPKDHSSVVVVVVVEELAGTDSPPQNAQMCMVAFELGPLAEERTMRALARCREARVYRSALDILTVADQELAKNFQLARSLEATGTPTFVVGDQILQGAVGYEALRDAIKEARAKS